MRDDPSAIPTDAAAVANVIGGDAALTTELAIVLEHSLSARERLVLIKRLGLFGSRAHTVDEVAKELGEPRNRVSVLEARAMERLRAPHVWARLAGYTAPRGLEPVQEDGGAIVFMASRL